MDLQQAALAAGVSAADMDVVMGSPRARGGLGIRAVLPYASAPRSRHSRRRVLHGDCKHAAPSLHAARQDPDEVAYEDTSPFELPNVDDLEVAAAAAAAAMEALATHGQTVGEDSSSEDEDDSDEDEDEDSDEDGSSGDEEMEVAAGNDQPQQAAAGHPPQLQQGQLRPLVRVSLQPNPAAAESVQLSIQVMTAPAEGAEVEEDSSPVQTSSDEGDDSSSSSSDDDMESDAEPIDYDQMRSMIDAAYAAVDEADAGACGGPKALHEALGLSEGVPNLQDMKITYQDELMHIGNVTAVVEDMAVVQGLVNMPALDEG